MKKIVAILMAMIMVISVTVVLAGSAADNGTKTKEPVIIGFESTPGPADKAIVRGHGGDIKYSYTIINAIAAKLPEPAIENIQKNPRVTYVERDVEVHTLEDTLPWGVDRIDAELVWNGAEDGCDVIGVRNAGTGIMVAIIDTGIDDDHPDLSVAGGRNYVVGSPFDDKFNDNWDDDNGHGTHCAGIVAALDNEAGVIGVAPEASLYAVKVLGSNGRGWTSDVIAGIQWSTSQGMDVISMSLGGGYSESMKDACNAADGVGIVVVAAAGNSGSGDNTVNYPAKYGSVIAVSATDGTDAIASFSSRGPEVELAAPGVSIYSTYKGGGYATMSGTSMACPHVAGTAALVIGSRITGSDAVRARLQNTAEDRPPEGKDNLYGYGLVDAFKAAGGEDITPPTISDLTPAGGAFVNTGTPTISATVTDVSGIDESSIVMTVDSADDSHSYDSETGIVSYIPTTTLAEGSHTVALEVRDTESNQATESWSFMVDTIPPAQVTDLAVTTVSSSQLDVSWTVVTVDTNGISEQIDHYNVYRSTTSGGLYDLVASPTTTTLYTDMGLEASTSYYYTVSAVDSSGNEGTAPDEVERTTSEAGGDVMHVSDISMWYDTRGPNYFIYTMVTINDGNSASVPEATVTLKTTLPGGSTVSDSGSTNGEGSVTFKLKSKQTGEYTSTVTDVKKSGWTYDPDADIETSASITV